MSAGRSRRVAVALAAVALAALTLRLGAWQLDRAAQKEALQQGIERQAALPPLDMAQLARTPPQAAAQLQRRAQAQGRWDAAHTVFLDNRQLAGRPGFYVLTPLRLADGSAVLVQRGWAPRDPQDRARLPEVPTPAQPVAFAARVAGAPARLWQFTTAAETGPLRQNLDLQAFARETGLALRPLTLLQLDADASAPPDGLMRGWPAPAADVHKHYGYAFQWFALAALTTGLYAWFQILRPRLRRQRA